jgi:hypothetical protein
LLIHAAHPQNTKRGKPSWELLFSGTVKVMQEEKGCGRPQVKKEEPERKEFILEPNQQFWVQEGRESIGL